jgi:acyl carrier protein
VELGEIEEVLNEYSGVRTSAVVAREDTKGDKRLVAYVVNRHGALSSSELREHLRTRLPDYMVPAVFVTLEGLPMTPNGKVDRKALPAPGFERIESGGNYVAPSSPTEKILAEIWAQSLGVEKVGIHDNFFDLGGHSLLLVRIQSIVCEKLKSKVSIVEMFQYPTISTLARHLTRPSTGTDRLQKIRERALRRTRALGSQRELKGKL